MLSVAAQDQPQSAYRVHPKVLLRDDGDYLGSRRLTVANKTVAGAIFEVDEVGRSLLEFLRVPRNSMECLEFYSRALTEHTAATKGPKTLDDSEVRREFNQLIEFFLSADILVAGEEALHTTGVHPGWTRPREFPDAVQTPASFPYVLDLDVTTRCNLLCRHCHTSADGEGLEEELTTEEIFRILDEADAEGLTTLKFTGGEPLLRRDIFDILDYAARKRFAMVLLSNCTLVDEGVADRLVETAQKAGGGLMLGIGTSLDGADAATHDAFRGLPGAFDRTTRAVELLADRGMGPVVQVCLHRGNLQQLSAIAELAQALGTSALLYYVPTQYGRAADPRSWLSREEIAAALDELDAIQGSHSSLAITYDAMRFVLPSRPSSSNPLMVDDEMTRVLALPRGTCAAGMYEMAVDADGNVYPCTFAMRGAEPPIGSVRRDSLASIWSSKAWQRYRGGWELSELHMCRTCADLSRCRTWACRAYPAADTGDFYGPASECRQMARSAP